MLSGKIEVVVPLCVGMCFITGHKRGRVIAVEDRRVKVSYHCNDKTEIEERWLPSHCIESYQWFVNQDALNTHSKPYRPEYNTPEEIDELIKMLMVVRSLPPQLARNPAAPAPRPPIQPPPMPKVQA